ncbi:hypothetical protein BGX38DRAFT_1329316 [Terfezia claveryi]|nr:hypothetical protein BGX38DRAFT_1329316 [Terfezia claveryi]
MEEKKEMPEGKTQSTPQREPSAPQNPKVNKHKRSQNPANLILRAPGLIRPPALTIPIDPRPVDVNLLQSLGALVHPLAQLRVYNYTTSNPTAEEIQAASAKLHEEATCKRCEKPFTYKDIRWDKISEDKCVHHPGKCSVEVNGKKLANGKPMKVWSCCYRRGFAPGCTTGPTHVLDKEDAGRLAGLCPFEATPSPVNTMGNATKIQKMIALDCEMSYTKYGLTLSRMSVLSFPDCRVLEDTFIREPYPGVHFFDYNTRFSGVTHENIFPDDPKSNPPVLEGIIAARSKLWEYCDENTIIIGHGLDHDMKCLRMLHSKIIDTAILFSKIQGHKSGLKKLAEVELKWSIQEDLADLTGHDSVEDCRTCIELVLKYLQRPAVAAESAASEIPD